MFSESTLFVKDFFIEQDILKYIIIFLLVHFFSKIKCRTPKSLPAEYVSKYESIKTNDTSFEKFNQDELLKFIRSKIKLTPSEQYNEDIIKQQLEEYRKLLIIDKTFTLSQKEFEEIKKYDNFFNKIFFEIDLTYNELKKICSKVLYDKIHIHYKLSKSEYDKLLNKIVVKVLDNLDLKESLQNVSAGIQVNETMSLAPFKPFGEKPFFQFNNTFLMFVNVKSINFNLFELLENFQNIPKKWDDLILLCAQKFLIIIIHELDHVFQLEYLDLKLPSFPDFLIMEGLSKHREYNEFKAMDITPKDSLNLIFDSTFINDVKHKFNESIQSNQEITQLFEITLKDNNITKENLTIIFVYYLSFETLNEILKGDNIWSMIKDDSKGKMKGKMDQIRNDFINIYWEKLNKNFFKSLFKIDSTEDKYNLIYELILKFTTKSQLHTITNGGKNKEFTESIEKKILSNEKYLPEQNTKIKIDSKKQSELLSNFSIDFLIDIGLNLEKKVNVEFKENFREYLYRFLPVLYKYLIHYGKIGIQFIILYLSFDNKLLDDFHLNDSFKIKTNIKKFIKGHKHKKGDKRKSTQKRKKGKKTKIKKRKSFHKRKKGKKTKIKKRKSFQKRKKGKKTEKRKYTYKRKKEKKEKKRVN